jgi:two-component system, NarL family, invasion response regulator UvrY
MIRIFIADDHHLIRAGFRQLAAEDHVLRVVGEAADGNTLLRQLDGTGTDVLILDIGMPGPGFLALLGQLKQQFPQLRVLMVSMHPEGELAIQALRAGAAGYVTKTEAPTQLLAAVAKVHAGGRYVSPTLAERLADALASGPRGRPHEALSAREYQVLCLLGAGKTNKQIAAGFKVGPKTISTYRGRVLRKLNLETNADLVRYVIEYGLTP